jgi:hypothetical protein
MPTLKLVQQRGQLINVHERMLTAVDALFLGRPGLDCSLAHYWHS